MISLVQEYFSQSALRFPDKTAVACQDETISYRQLDAYTNGLARYLPVKRGSLVGFFLPKSINSIKAILAILKADCAYIPLDVNSPAPRLASIIATGNLQLVIVNQQTRALFKTLLPDSPVTLICLDELAFSDSAAIDYKNLSIDLAYVLFTSGSTGIPKGVMIPHKAIIDYIDWCVETYALTNEDIIANHAPLYFDNSTFDLYTAFKTGATLHLVHDELNAVIPRLIKWLDERAISTFFCVPSVLTLLQKSRRLKPDNFSRLRHIICAGEVLPVDLLRDWMQAYPHIQFTNMYGPTEITVDCSYHLIQQLPDTSDKHVPIGKARKNMALLVRTASGELSTEPGVEGELLVRGTSVAYGYLGDTERSRQQFIQNPLHNIFHDPLYCTGDLVRIDERGNFLFLGRADDQIKFLGYRIELGEIEASLRKLSCVAEVVVVFNNSADESQRELGALIQLASQVSVAELRNLAASVLPGYMQPTRVLLWEAEFPRTNNGKYDRKQITQLVFN